ncbi:MAG: purine-binding chemotaxis protein CheW [Bacteroidales bacterium]|nr:purine-binding chemotaxis protein CheW [Bacteroidales bacterium]
MVKQNVKEIIKKPENNTGFKDAIRKRTILKHRADLLKISVNKEEVAREQLEVLEFMLASEKYIIDSSFVIEVIPLKDLTPLPCTPEFILGIINIKGRILAVINIKKFLNLPEKGITNLNRVILLKYQDIELGILADEITRSTKIYPDKLQATNTTLKGIQNDYLVGITEDRSILLNIKKILTSKMIIINDEV